MGEIELASKTTVAGDLESSLSLSYNPLSGTMEVRIAKPTEEKMLFKIETEITSPAVQPGFEKASEISLKKRVLRIRD